MTVNTSTSLNTESRNAVTEKTSKISFYIHAIGATVGALVFLVAVYIVHHELKTTSFHQIVQELTALEAHKVALAFVFMLVSYFSLTNYDRLGLVYLGRTLNPWTILGISFSAVAVGHNVGFSAVSAGSIRYRAYSVLGLSTTEIASLIAFCSVTFAVGGALLFGAVLLWEPASALAPMGVSAMLLKLLGCVLILVPLSYAAAVLFLRDGVTVKGIKIPMPSRSIAIQQLFFASLDLLASAAVLYFLLPTGSGISYPMLLSAYLLAILLGMISNVPGGVGVFEGILLLLLPSLPEAELLGSIIVYRIVYYIIPLLAAIGLLLSKEIAIHRQHLTSFAKRGTEWISGIAPQVIGLVVFIAGVVLLISGTLPGDKSRLHFIADILPLSFLEFSHMLNSAIGVGLLIVARGLYQRLRGAYHFALLLLGAGVLFSLGKGLDFEESFVLMLVAGLLVVSRDEFYRPAALIDSRFTFGWIVSIVAVIAATLWIGLFVYKHIEYRDSLWWQFAFDANAPRMLRGMLSATIVIAAFGIFRLTRSPPAVSVTPSSEELGKAKEIAQKSELSSANIVLLGDKRLLFHPDGDTFIMYQTLGNTWLALGDPVGNAENFEALVWQFRELSYRQGNVCAFYQVRAQNLALYIDLGMSLSKLGEEARVPLKDFSLEGRQSAELRQARNKALRNGAAFEIIAACDVPRYMDQLRQISDEWLANKATHEKGFSIGNFNPDYLVNFDCAVVKYDGEILAFANLWLGANLQELSIDLMRYSSRAPKGVMDYLFVELLLWGKQNSYQKFSLGMAPLSGLEKHPLAPLWHKVGNGIFRFGDNFYNFDGLRSYKDKFNPEWEPLYLAAPGGLAFPRVLVESAILISGGLKEIFAK